MADDPFYIKRLLAEARDEGQWYYGQADAAAKCFEVLADRPDHAEAHALLYDLFCDEWLIYENRKTLQRLIDEWDDRPWQQRRRFALSFRSMSRWPGWRRDRTGPPDVAALLREGKGELLGAYCLGDEECADAVWPIFMQAVAESSDPRTALLWVGKCYADLGFFADAAEALTTLTLRFNNADARRLLAEVGWWRDNSYRIPWFPPDGDGSRFRRIIRLTEPDAPDDESQILAARTRLRQRKGQLPPSVISPQVARIIVAALPSDSPAAPAPSLVDWSFLDGYDGQPGNLPAWVGDFEAQAGIAMPEHLRDALRLSRPIPSPANPPRYPPGTTLDGPDDLESFDDLDDMFGDDNDFQ